MKDNFSAQSAAYSKFRPQYPDDMISYVMSFVKTKKNALDLATGNGQVAVKFAKYFKIVYATDSSAKQLENAIVLPNIIYKQEFAERTDFTRGQFDLITVAQAVHWFNFDEFYAEVYRILSPDGVFAILGYGLFSTNPESDEILRDYYRNIVGPYWDAERKYLDENYKTIPFPFHESETREFTNDLKWSFEALIGYLETWSATQHYKEANGINPIDHIYDKLKISWANSNKKVRFPMLLRIGKLKNQ